jgi:hypothetical protein
MDDAPKQIALNFILPGGEKSNVTPLAQAGPCGGPRKGESWL